MHLTCLIMHMFVKWTICTQHEFSPYSFNISMSNMVIMHTQHLKLIWETLWWFAHLDVRWTIYHLTLENLFDMLMMSICTMCVDVKWTTCSLNMNFLSMSIQHVLTLLTRCQINMSNEHHFCIFAERVALLVVAFSQWRKFAKTRILKSKIFKMK